MRFPSLGRRFGALAAVLLLGLTACSGDGGGSPDEQRLIIAQAIEPRSLFPNVSTAQQEVNVSAQITEKLIEFSVDALDYDAVLAESWEKIDDSTIRLQLRQGVSFTNGEPFNAESAVASIEVMRNAEAYASFTSPIGGAEVVDEHTIDITASEPNDLMMLALAMGSFQYPKEYLAEVGPDGFGNAPIGTGPFTLKEWRKGDRITMTSNPEYWGGETEVSHLEFRYMPDRSAAVAALESGSVDFVVDVPIGDIPRMRDSAEVDLVTRPSNRVFYMTLSTLTDTPLQDVKVRQALQHAIDVDALIQGPLAGLGEPLQGQLLTPNYFGFNPDLVAPQYDPELARQMLAEAGYPDGFSITFKYSNGRYLQDRELGQAIAQQLAAVGVDTTQEVLEPGTFLDQLLQKELNDVFSSGALPPPDGHFLYQTFVSDFVYSYFDNPQVDALVKEQATTVDRGEREAILHELGALMFEEAPVIPMFQGTDSYAMRTEVQGFEPRATQYLKLTGISISGE